MEHPPGVSRLDLVTDNDYWLRCMIGMQLGPKAFMQSVNEIRLLDMEVKKKKNYPPTTRTIAVPLQGLDRCTICGTTQGLRVCNSCASAIYCSQTCQKADWPTHKASCTRTSQINLKTFYPFISYLFEYLRKIASPYDGRYRHPAMNLNIGRGPMPLPRKAPRPNTTTYQTIHLTGDDTQDGPDDGLVKWVKFKIRFRDRTKWWYQVTREELIFELTTAVALLLLAEIYSTHFDKPGQKTGAKPRYRLEYGHSPISDFGICKGRIRGERNRLQVWDYVHPVTQEKERVLDPDNHYWIYFKTILGEEVTLDCSSFSYGMDMCVDASECSDNLPRNLWSSTCKKVPAYFRTPDQDEHRHYTLIEEKRFSVMQNTRLHQVLVETHRNSIFSFVPEDEKKVFREFMEEVSGKPWEPFQEELFWWHRVCGGGMLRMVLESGDWKYWKKPIKCKGFDTFGFELLDGCVDEFTMGLVDLAIKGHKYE